MIERIEKLVRYYTTKFGTNDPYLIAEYLGIHVMQTPLGNISGMYKYIERSKWIFINNENGNETNNKIVMAHELGHALMHWKENCCFMSHHTLLLTSKIERHANLFAAILLITDELLQQYKGCTIEQFSNCTGIDEDLIKLRLKYIGG